MRTFWILAIITIFSTSAACSAPVRLAAENWPPFLTPTLPDNGVTGALVGAVLKRSKDDLVVDYFPWKRAVEYGLHNPLYVGYMAVWRTPEREKLCYFSSPVGTTQLVLAYMNDEPISATDLQGIKAERIGVVAGYANGDEFDTLVRDGTLKVEEAVSDEANLRKLLLRRFPAIVIEKHVLRYLLSSPQFKPFRDRVAISSSLFQERSVYVCFKRTSEGLAHQYLFNKVAGKLNMKKIEREYWHRIGYENQ